MKQLLHKIARYFLPVLFISYIGCISLFTHSHVVNGVTIVHSHPYKPGTEHEHTTAEFQLIHMLFQYRDGESVDVGFCIGDFVFLLQPVVFPVQIFLSYFREMGRSWFASSARFGSVI